MKSLNIVSRVVPFTCVVLLAGAAWADPLPGQFLKFRQDPMIATPITDTTGTTHVYFGHDQLSTALRYPNDPPGHYRGMFMADDFADNYDTPVVHVTWWGSYLNTPVPNPKAVQKFLIAFEDDVPVSPINPWSFPGNVLSTEVVTWTGGPLTPQSGNFTEQLVSGSNPAEPVYKYNAELKLPFAQKKDTVYWLKIVALDDVLPGVAPIQWGWHNRDYTINDPLASPNVSPGETLVNPVLPMWHFQDDAVQGKISTALNSVGSLSLTQTYDLQAGEGPQRYLDGWDGPAGVGQYSKDLAFELHSANVPEPGTWTLLAAGAVGGMGIAWRRRKPRSSPAACETDLMKPERKTPLTRSKGRMTKLCRNLFCAGLLLAIAASTSPARAFLLVDPGFESNPLTSYTNVLTNFPAFQGVWGVESATIVGAENGVTPAQGVKMLRMTDDGLVATQGFQATDVSSYAAVIDAGAATVNLSALFNVDGNVPTASGGVYVQFFSASNWGSQIGVPLNSSLALDSSPNSWEAISAGGSVPPGTRWLVSQVLYNNASLAGNDGLVHPGYVDAADLRITPEPGTLALLLGGGLTGLLFYVRRRRQFREGSFSGKSGLAKALET